MDSGSVDFERHYAAYNDIVELSTKELSNTSTKTSSQKLKAFPDEAQALLENAALTEPTNFLFHSLLFVRANLLVGLRPIEWFDAKLIEYQHTDAFGQPKKNVDGSQITSIALRVLNAKHFSVRGNGDARTILLDKLSEFQLAYLKDWLVVVNELKSMNLLLMTEAAINKKIYSQLQRAIRRVLVKADWKGNIPTI